MPGARLLRIASSGCRITDEMPSGAAMMKRRDDLAGSNASAPEMTLRTRASTSAIGSGQLRRARGRHHALRRAQEQRIVEQQPQPLQAVTDRGRRQVQPRGGAADVALAQDHLEQRQQVEVGAG